MLSIGLTRGNLAWAFWGKKAPLLMRQMKQHLTPRQGNLHSVHLGCYFAQGGCGLPIPGAAEDQALSDLI